MKLVKTVFKGNTTLRSLVFRIFISCIAGVGLVILCGLMSGWYLDASVKISIDTNDPIRIKAYYNTGHGYHEEETALKSSVFGVEYLPLPKTQLVGLRLDIETDITQLGVQSICFTSIFASHCWRGDSLAEALLPTNNVVLERKGDIVSEIVAGQDPYVELIGDIGGAHHNVAVMSPKRVALITAIFSIALFSVWTFLQATTIGRRFVNSWFTHVRSGSPVPLGAILSSYVLCTIVFAGYWSGLYEIWGLSGYVVLLVCLLTLCQLLSNTQIFLFKKFKLPGQAHLSKKAFFSAVICTTLVCLPVFWYLFATWNQEFPHIGDHEFYYWSNTIAYREFVSNPGVYRSMIGLLIVATVTGYWRLAIVLMIAAIFYFDAGSEMQEVFSRYPGGGRMLNLPFMHMSVVQDWSSPLNAGRLANSLAVPIWLMVLRPLLLGRWPNWLILPVGLLMFYQAETVYLFTTAYLDPWATITVLLATELLLRAERQNDYLKACLVLGVGAVVKEQVVFLIPWVWMAGKPWLHDNRRKLLALAVGACSVLPFILYYFIRRASGFSRYDYVGIGQIFSGQWQTEFWHRVVFHFGVTGLVMLVLVAIFWIFVLMDRNFKQYRFSLLMMFGGLVSLVLLFNLDVGGMAFTGYPRFYLPVLALLAAPLFLLSRFSDRPSWRNAAVTVACSIILIGNLPTLSTTLSKTSAPDAVRNFNEHYDAPIYLPIKALIETANEDGALRDGQSIFIRLVTGWNQPTFVYPHIIRDHPMQVLHDQPCNCDQGGATLQPFVYPAGLHEIGDMYDPETPGYPLLPRQFAPRWSEVNEGKSACLAELKRSCSYYAEQKIGDFVTGAIGVN